MTNNKILPLTKGYAYTITLDDMLHEDLKYIAAETDTTLSVVMRTLLRCMSAKIGEDFSAMTGPYFKEIVNLDSKIMQPDIDRLLDEGYYRNKEAAAYIGIAYSTLCAWRNVHTKRKSVCPIIPYTKIGRYVLYKKEDLDNYKNERTKNETPQ